jgi:hypothetical protein
MAWIDYCKQSNSSKQMSKVRVYTLYEIIGRLDCFRSEVKMNMMRKHFFSIGN